jgi:hypothetical protein
MKPKYILIVFAAVAVAACVVFVVLNFPRQVAPPGLVSTAMTFLRDLVGHNPPELPRTTRKILEFVPFGTSLEAARQIMTQHQFSCSVDSYTNPAQTPNSAIWNRPFVKGGLRLAVTNVSRLTCATNGCVVTFWVVNGETTSLAVKGEL